MFNTLNQSQNASHCFQTIKFLALECILERNLLKKSLFILILLSYYIVTGWIEYEVAVLLILLVLLPTPGKV